MYSGRAEAVAPPLRTMFRLNLLCLALVAVLALLPSSLADDSLASRKRLFIRGEPLSKQSSPLAARQVQASSLRRRRIGGVDDATRLGFMARRKRGDGPQSVRGKRSGEPVVEARFQPTFFVGTPALESSQLDKRGPVAPDSTSPRAWRHGNMIKSQDALTAFVAGTANEMVN